MNLMPELITNLEAVGTGCQFCRILNGALRTIRINLLTPQKLCFVRLKLISQQMLMTRTCTPTSKTLNYHINITLLVIINLTLQLHWHTYYLYPTVYFWQTFFRLWNLHNNKARYWMTLKWTRGLGIKLCEFSVVTWF